MRVVSENSEAELARKRAIFDVERRLRELTANLLRVVRGAGRPYAIVSQALELAGAIVEYQTASGRPPAPEDFLGVLNFERGEDEMARFSSEVRAQLYAEERMVRGALQIAASRLLGQNTQVRAGWGEMIDGKNALDEAWRKEMERIDRIAGRALPGRRGKKR